MYKLKDNKMKNISLNMICISLITVFALSAMPVVSVAKKAAAKKPAKRIVLGTKQLDGSQAKLGVTYTLGKQDPINVTLNKIEYSVEPIRFGSTILVPKSDQKLLVLHYTLHNCKASDRYIGWSAVDINAVDSNDTNWRYIQDVSVETTFETCKVYLKPAQKIKLYTAILVPAKGEIPKLMIQSSDKLVLRYDIRGKASPLPDPIADPADPTKATALERVPAQMGTYYPMGDLHGKIDSVEFSTEPFKEQPPKKGYRYLVIKGSARNNLFEKRGLSWGTFVPKVVDGDGGQIDWGQETYFASRDEGIRSNIEPGQELRFRWVFDVPEKLPLQNISVTEGNGRAFVYDLSQIK